MRRPNHRTRPEAKAQAALRPPHLYLLFFGWTLFSVFVYSHFSTLGDSQSYLTGAYDEMGTRLRTSYHPLAELVYSVVHVDSCRHLVFSLFAATGVALMIKQAKLARQLSLAVARDPADSEFRRVGVGDWARIPVRRPARILRRRRARLLATPRFPHWHCWRSSAWPA